jgi:hypothetical protein
MRTWETPEAERLRMVAERLRREREAMVAEFERYGLLRLGLDTPTRGAK